MKFIDWLNSLHPPQSVVDKKHFKYNCTFAWAVLGNTLVTIIGIVIIFVLWSVMLYFSMDCLWSALQLNVEAIRGGGVNTLIGALMIDFTIFVVFSVGIGKMGLLLKLLYPVISLVRLVSKGFSWGLDKGIKTWTKALNKYCSKIEE